MRRSWLIILLLGLVSLPLSRAAAAELTSQCTIGQYQVIPGNLYTTCDSLVIDGTVQGDVIAVAGTITVNGTIQGDLLAVAGEVVVRGTVHRNVRTVAARLWIAPGAQLHDHQDIAGIGLSAELDAEAEANLYFNGYQAILRGALHGDVRFDGQALSIGNVVSGRIDGAIRDAVIQPPNWSPLGLVFVGPGLSYQDQGKVQGDFALSLPGDEPFLQSLGKFLMHALRDAFTLTLIGLLIVFLPYQGLPLTARRLRSQALDCTAIGVVSSILALVSGAILFALSVLVLGLISLITFGELTLMFGLILGAINLSVFGVMGFVIAFLSRLVVAYFIGGWLVSRFFVTAGQQTAKIATLILGTLIYALVTNISFLNIGLILNVIAICVGLGAIIIEIRELVRGMRLQQALSPSPLLPDPLTSAALAAPPESPEKQPGMDNLPQGFEWFDE